MWVLAILTSRSNIRATKDLQGGGNTPSMNEGWLCITSYDEIAHTWWWPGEIQIELWSRSSYDDSERSRSSDDLDPAVMIHIERWSRSSDDPDPVQWWWSKSRDDPDPVMMIQQWWSRSSDDPDPVQWCWSRSRDDPDLVMLIQIERWSRSSDDVPWWSRSRDDPDSKNEDDLKTKMTWRLKRLEMQMMRWSSWYKEED